MRKVMKFGSLMGLIVALASCSKDNVSPSGGASLIIVNAIVGSSNLVTNFTSNTPLIYYQTAQQISFGSYKEFGNYSGTINLSLSQIIDTTHTLFNGVVNLPQNAIQTLFLTGTTTLPESFQTTDTLSYHNPTDSTVGVRFVNLSPGSNPISVNISGNSNGSEIASLVYKNITSFKNYPATSAVSSYVFQIRDAGSGTLLGTFTMSGINNGTGTNTSNNVYRYRNVTIALKGLPGGSGNNAQGTFLISNY